MNTEVKLLPWFDPNETERLTEVLMRTVSLLRNTAKFSSVRKDIKWEMESNADEIERITLNDRTRMHVDSAIFLALEEIGLRHSLTIEEQITQALETYISRYNKKGNHK